jgi:hypothetical protein
MAAGVDHEYADGTVLIRKVRVQHLPAQHLVQRPFHAPHSHPIE